MRKLADNDLEIDPCLTLPEAEIREAASRSSGPGGQHVNKSNTRVTLRWNIAQSQALTLWQRSRLLEQLASRLTSTGELLVQVDQTRSQHSNRSLARQRRAAIVTKALERQKPRRKTRPTRASQRRRVDGKKQRGAVKQMRNKVRGGDD